MGFDIGSILASLVGGGAGFLVGGPIGAAVGSGLATTAYTGDLGKGIVSGLLGYGLGSAGDLLAGAGGAAGATGAAGAAGEAGSKTMEQVIAQNKIPESLGERLAQGWDKVGAIGQGLSNPAALGNTFINNGLRTTLPIGLGAYGLTQDFSQGQQQPQQPTYGVNINSQYNPRRYIPPPPGADPYGRERTYFSYADGGEVDDEELEKKFKEDEEPLKRLDKKTGRWKYNEPGWQVETENYDERRASPRGFKSRNPFTDTDRVPIVRFAAGGIAGRMISGPGGGIADAIPTMVDGRHRAALSSGEFVVPAHAVSALGDGSSEEGARQLNRMVDGIMRHKYGTKNRRPRPMRAMGMK